MPSDSGTGIPATSCDTFHLPSLRTTCVNRETGSSLLVSSVSDDSSKSRISWGKALGETSSLVTISSALPIGSRLSTYLSMWNTLIPPLSGWYKSTLPATSRCLIASKAAIRVEEASISDITARSMEERASSTSALAPSSWANCSNLKSSTVRRKNGALGGSNASNILEDKLLTPRAPMP